MSITITITDPTPAQIAKLAALIEQETPEDARVAQTAPPDAEKPKAASKKAEPKAEEPKPEADEPAASDEDVPSTEDVKAAAQTLVNANGRDALAELVTEFKAKNLSGIAEGDRAKFIAACEKKTT